MPHTTVDHGEEPMRATIRRLGTLLAVSVMGAGLLAGPAQAAPSGGAGRFKITIMSVQCLRTEDNSQDEAYLLINGERVWSNNSVDEPNSYAVNIDWKFDPNVWIQLWDDDGNHWYDHNDLLGQGRLVVSTGADPTPEDNTVFLNPNSMATSNSRFHFTQGSNYYLFFTVTLS